MFAYIREGTSRSQITCKTLCSYFDLSTTTRLKQVSLDVPVTKMYQINFDPFSSGSLKTGSFSSLSVSRQRERSSKTPPIA